MSPAGSSGRSTRRSTAPRFRHARRGWRRRCATRCFPAAPASAPGCVTASPRPAARTIRAATEAAGAALELLHCASLVHDDLPCFDAADTRRGRPSVHKAFGEPLAVLAGDALIVLAFQTLARVPCAPQRLAILPLTVAQSVGVPSGIVAGQAWECEPQIDLAHYHRAKTGALFAAATVAGAASAGADAEPWRMVGEKLGEAYQVADDIRDAARMKRKSASRSGGISRWVVPAR